MSGEFNTNFAGSGQIDQEDQSTNIDAKAISELQELADRYPQSRSALLPMLHYVQSVDGRVSPRGIEICAEILGISAASVAGVATFYTMYKRKPNGKHNVGICTTSLCATMGGDILLAQAKEKLGINVGETTEDGQITLEAIECNAACDYAPVMMVNWEFFDNMNPQKLDDVLDALTNDREVKATRGATITSWREAERVLSGFLDGRADEGPAAGPASLRGLEIAKERGWSAPDPNNLPKQEDQQ